MVIQARRYHKPSYRPCRQAEYQFPRVNPRVIRRQWASELTARPKIPFDRFGTQKHRWKRIAGETSDSFSQRNISTEDTSIRFVYPFQSSGSIYLSFSQCFEIRPLESRNDTHKAANSSHPLHGSIFLLRWFSSFSKMYYLLCRPPHLL